MQKKGNRRKGEGDDAWDKGMGEYFASVFAVIPNEWNIFIYLPNIGRICYKENHHVNSLDLNGPKIHAIYLVELRKRNDMMA